MRHLVCAAFAPIGGASPLAEWRILRCINGFELLPFVRTHVGFRDGIHIKQTAEDNNTDLNVIPATKTTRITTSKTADMRAARS
jgi:hypothetical protein